MPDFGRVSLIDASPNDAASAYVAVKNYQNDDLKPYIFKTADYGKTWTKITNGIAENDFVHAVREDPAKRGLLYAGTEHGIYVSFDDGAQWQSLALNLPDTQVPDLVIEGNDLVIATHGRSFYILDNITPLRQLTPAVMTSNSYLFRPPTAARNVSQGRISYFLKQPADKVQIDILDAKGQVVRTYTGSAEEDARGGRGGRGGRGAAAATADDSGGEDDGGGGGRGGGTPPVPRKAGLNNFAWDLHYPGAKGFQGMVLWGAGRGGPIAVPGPYTVKLTVNGQTLTERMNVEKDPRIDSVTVADLTEQFKFALQIRDKTTEANEMVITIRELKKQMDDRQKQNAELKAAFDPFRKKLSAVEEEVYQVQNRSGQDPLNFPIKLNNKMAALERVVETGDGKPIAASYTVFKDLSDQLAAQKAKLESALKDLPAVNQQVTAKGLKPLEITTTESKTP